MNVSNYHMKPVWALFLLFCVGSLAYLGSVPGLLGDEGSEGENIFELHEREGITVTGERSYIGPAIDYLRIPFIAAFGYTAFALRILIILFSVATFWFAYEVFKKSFGELPGLYALTLFSFSPIFLLYQRVGWTITLFPFFALLILFILQKSWPTKWVWAGLAAGLGLANHIIFLPSLVGVTAGVGAWYLMHLKAYPLKSSIRAGLLALVGFWAGFGMQFVVLALNTEDQGDPSATTQLFSERVSDFPSSLPIYISGSSFVARYIGVEFSPVAIMSITWVLFALAAAGIVLQRKNKVMWAWLIGTAAHIAALLYVIDRFSLRYFVVISLLVWVFAGVGLGSLLEKIKRDQVVSWGNPVIATLLIVWMMFAVVIPFRATGGSTSMFSLGNREDSASAFVDVRPLVACLENAGSVSSESVHIWNRLQYLSHSNEALEVIPEARFKSAQLLVQYRDKEHPEPGDVCPELAHFRVLQAQ